MSFFRVECEALHGLAARMNDCGEQMRGAVWALRELARGDTGSAVLDQAAAEFASA